MEVLALIVSSTLFFLGVLGIFLPVLPSTILVWAGIAIHQLWMAPLSVGWKFVIVAGIITLLAELLDFVASYLGAKKFGATWKGALGALVGAIVGGIFFNLPGLILGPIIGAMLFEFIEQRSWRAASRAGIGAIVGSLFAQGTKLAVSVGLVIAFYFYL
ncbi:MAG: DUF456 domain-containing protein [Verrucomicrobiota bacterium JB022]|nr:DUF456 domain-containing protein [Verrucomicrobiota bacterium JB022]